MTLAEKALSSVIKRRLVRSAIIKDAKGWQALYEQLQKALSTVVDGAMRDAIVGALDRLRDLGPGAFTEADGRTILAAVEGAMGPEALRAAAREPVLNLSDALFRIGAAEVGQAAGVDIAFMRPDLDALDALKEGNLFWVGETWNSYTKDKIAAVLTEYFHDGMTRDQLAKRLAEDFATVTGRSHVYFEILADHMAVKTREIGRVTGYERAGIELVQVRAHLDERTTPICRHMNGRIFRVSAMRAQVEAYNSASRQGNVAEMKRVWPMHGADTDLSNVPTNALSGACCPPYHFRCRTRTVAYWASASEASAAGEREVTNGLGSWRRAAYDREPLGREAVGAVIDRARTASWPHEKVVRGKFRKHGAKLGIATQADFSEAAVGLIRRADRDVYLSVRKGQLNATFVRPRRIALPSGKERDGFEVTAVDLEANKITSYHWRAKIETTADEVPAQKQPGRGIRKWLARFLG